MMDRGPFRLGDGSLFDDRPVFDAFAADFVRVSGLDRLDGGLGGG
jgi:hypothetical protein